MHLRNQHWKHKQEKWLDSIVKRLGSIKASYTEGIQSLTVLSLEAEATRCPEGENFTHITAS
mgnify:CR=1 FL=1